MTSPQKAVVLVGAVLFAGMGVCPPWVLKVPAVTVPLGSGLVLPAKYRHAGYAFVTSPPAVTDWVRTPASMDPLPPEPSKPSSSILPEEDWLSRRADIRQDELGSVNSRSAEIDWSRLAAQWMSLIVLCAGGFVVTGNQEPGARARA